MTNSKTPLYLLEHPDFDNGEIFETLLKELAPLGFVDSSWRNDLCPCARVQLAQPESEYGEQYIQIHVNYSATELMDDPEVNSTYFLSWQGQGMNGVLCDTYNEPTPLLAAIKGKVALRDGLIADLFRANINHWLTREESQQVDSTNAMNAGSEFEGCATHDYCDSNMAMAPAFESVMGFELDPTNESHCAVFNQAWDIAKQRGFYLSLFDAIEIEIARGFDDMTSGLIQGVIGVDDGGFAGMFFSGIPESEWDSMSGVEKRDTLANYITSEINHNAEIN